MAIKNKKKLYEEYKKVILDEGGEPPSSFRLLELGRSDIINAFSKKGLGIPKIKVEEDLGYTPHSKKEKEKVFIPPRKVKELITSIYNKFGNGKSINIQLNKDIFEYLKREGTCLSALQSSIKHHFGNKSNLDEEIGFGRILKDWSEGESMLEREYSAECRNHGNVSLSFDFLNNIGRSDIVNAFRRLKIDKNEFDERLGFKPLQRNVPWTNEEILSKFKFVCDKFNGGKPLGEKELISLGYGDLNGAIHKHFDSKYEVYELLDMDFIRRDHWGYDDYFNTYKEMGEACGNRSLSAKDCKDLGIGYINSWISKTYDSRDELDKLCKFAPKTYFRLSDGSFAKSGYEVRFANFLIANNISFKNEGVIDKNSRKKYKYDFLLKDINGKDVYFEIWGLKTNRFFNNVNFDSRKTNYSKKTKNKKAFYRRRKLKLVSIDGNVFESSNTSSIQDFFKEILISNKIKLDNFKILRTHELLNADSDTTLNKLEIYDFYGKLCLGNGDKPISVKELIKMGHANLNSAIQKIYPGGKKQLDIDSGYKHMRSLTYTLDEVKNILKNLAEQNNGVPIASYFELRKMGYKTLISNLSKLNTNLKKIYTELGYDFRPSLGRKHKKTIKRIEKNGSEIIEKYNKYGSKKSAELFGVDPGTIQRWVKECGGELKKHKFNTVKKEDVAKNLKKLGVIKCAELYGVAKITFYGWVKKFNLTHLLPNDQNKKIEFLNNNAEEILAYSLKLGTKAAAQKYGFKDSTIRRLVKKHKKSTSL